ncbi:hypothetical protein [Thioclava pacifica]|uniref:Uncharacterized protein n=1 Tax=Thioclava pacifica DSM 10166 TaxID=1353537 RepID=A0A074JET1_9RHOB|nr:hypothetical protein [Thioclava pacifica]KEO54073.1 hypothetical protein TP2_03925 [Thioclava pacifica DSM 10166]
MRSDYPSEARGRRFFFLAALVSAFGIATWIAVADPLSGNESVETTLAVASK